MILAPLGWPLPPALEAQRPPLMHRRSASAPFASGRFSVAAMAASVALCPAPVARWCPPSVTRRLLCPGGFPGESTGGACLFLLQDQLYLFIKSILSYFMKAVKILLACFGPLCIFYLYCV